MSRLILLLTVALADTDGDTDAPPEPTAFAVLPPTTDRPPTNVRPLLLVQWGTPDDFVVRVGTEEVDATWQLTDYGNDGLYELSLPEPLAPGASLVVDRIDGSPFRTRAWPFAESGPDLDPPGALTVRRVVREGDAVRVLFEPFTFDRAELLVVSAGTAERTVTRHRAQRIDTLLTSLDLPLPADPRASVTIAAFRRDAAGNLGPTAAWEGIPDDLTPDRERGCATGPGSVPFGLTLLASLGLLRREPNDQRASSDSNATS
jgi:hypothetical protein